MDRFVGEWDWEEPEYSEENSNICTVAAVSLEGEQREIITLTSDNETVDHYGYHEKNMRQRCGMWKQILIFLPISLGRF